MLLDEIAQALRQAFGVRQRNAGRDYRPDPKADRFPDEFQSDHAKADDAGVPRVTPALRLPRCPLRVSLKAGGLEDSVLNAICGYAPRTVGGSYGSVPLAAQRRAVERFPRFDLRQ
jgi:hypothetical protein